MNYALFFQVLALVLLVLAGLGVPSPARFQLGWFGLAAWLFSLMVGR